MDPSLPSRVRARFAAVYVRQSDPVQVERNTGSQAWQQGLKHVAVQLGWDEERVLVFEEPGVSARAAGRRPVFAELLRLIGERQIGMVFVIEPTRASRNEQDWAALKDTCVLTGTWLHVNNRVMDLSNPSHRFRLGIAQAVAVATSARLAERLQRSALEKLRAGRMRVALPTGYEHGFTLQEGRMVHATVMASDQAVRSAIAQVFTLYEDLQSATGVAGYYQQRNLTLPRRDAGAEAPIRWVVPNRNTILTILRNPTYAGAYTYFRTRYEWRVTPDGRLRGGIVRKSEPATWDVLLLDAHPGYITWEQYLRVRDTLRENRFGAQVTRARSGAALLQGLVVCGTCGHRMTVAYTPSGAPTYRCDWAKRLHKGRLCQNMQGTVIEQAVINLVFEALTPVQLALSAQVQDELGRVRSREHEMETHRLAQLEQEVDTAKGSWKAALRISLERSLGDDLLQELEADVQRSQHELLAYQRQLLSRPPLTPQGITPAQRQRLNQLCTSVQALWDQVGVDHRTRKQILRCLITRVELRKDADAGKIYVVVHWLSGAISSLFIDDSVYRFRHGTSKAVVDLIRELSVNHTTVEIAQHLEVLGHRTADGRPLTSGGIYQLKKHYGIPVIKGERGPDGHYVVLPAHTYTATAAAEAIGISRKTLIRWYQKGLLGPLVWQTPLIWNISLPPERLAALQQYAVDRRTTSATPEDLRSFQAERLSDEQWTALRPFTRLEIEGKLPYAPRGRDVVDAMAWVYRHNATWNRLPPTMLDPKTYLRQLQTWHKGGILSELVRMFSVITGDEALLHLYRRLRDAPTVAAAFTPRFPGIEDYPGAEVET